MSRMASGLGVPGSFSAQAVPIRLCAALTRAGRAGGHSHRFRSHLAQGSRRFRPPISALSAQHGRVRFRNQFAHRSRRGRCTRNSKDAELMQQTGKNYTIEVHAVQLQDSS